MPPSRRAVARVPGPEVAAWPGVRPLRLRDAGTSTRQKPSRPTTGTGRRRLWRRDAPKSTVASRRWRVKVMVAAAVSAPVSRSGRGARTLLVPRGASEAVAAVAEKTLTASLRHTITSTDEPRPTTTHPHQQRQRRATRRPNKNRARPPGCSGV